MIDMQGLMGRDIFLWGAGRWGRVICLRLEKCGLRVAGFLDSNADNMAATVLGRPVARPEPFLAAGPGGEAGPILVVTPHFFKEAMLPLAEAAGFARGKNLFVAEDFTPHHYIVEVSGVCNLSCLACPRGRKTPLARRGGFMSLDNFAKVVRKIVREDPLAANLQLYQWGEPLLNPDLSRMIALAKEEGLPVSISSNLNADVDLAPVLAAGPDWFRVSVSGAGADYERTHAGGRWDKLLAGLARLAEAQGRVKSPLRIELYYHLYQHNQGEDLQTVAALCQKYGFEFQPVQAYLIGLEEVLANLEGTPLPPQAQEAAKLLAVKTEDALALAQRDKAKPCPVEKVVMVDWDLSVPNCLMYYGQDEHTLSNNFLEIPLADILSRRAKSKFCARCRAHAMHRYCDVYYNWPQKKMDI